jgi:hypothetical protein
MHPGLRQESISHMWNRQSGRVCTITLLVALSGSVGAVRAQTKNEESRRPRLTLRATPNLGVAPARVVLTAELVGGANDFEEYYCPTVEWDWDDDTRSEQTSDCEPYESGKSEIRRRFTVEHIFRRPGEYRLSMRLKQRDKIVGAATTNISIRPGISND